MAVNIKIPRVDEWIAQLRQLTGRQREQLPLAYAGEDFAAAGF